MTAAKTHAGKDRGVALRDKAEGRKGQLWPWLYAWDSGEAGD